MLLDKNATVSDNQTIAAAASTIDSTSSYDLGASNTDNMGNTPPQDVGRSQVELFCQVTETVASGGAATVTFRLIQSAAADLSTPTVIASTAAIALATLVAGYQPRLELPAGITQRYLGLQYVIATATTTAGKVTASFIAPGSKQTSYSI